MLTYTHKEMKQAAKNSLQGRWGVAIGCFLLASFLPAMVLSGASGFFSVFTEFAALEELYGVYSLIAGADFLFTTAVTVFFLGPLSIGYIFFSLRFVRGTEVSATMPYKVFTAGQYGRLTLAYFMMLLFISLWSLLFFIPGIIKSLSYAQMPYLLMDHPEMGWKEALDESRRMMDGHKWDYFVLNLSFLGWILLGCVTFGIALIYVDPYMQMTFANYYRALKEERLDVVKTLPGQQF